MIRRINASTLARLNNDTKRREKPRGKNKTTQQANDLFSNFADKVVNISDRVNVDTNKKK